MEEEKKEVKEESKTKKSTDFLTLICFAVIAIVIVSFLVGRILSEKYNGKKVSIDDFKSSEIRAVPAKDEHEIDNYIEDDIVEIDEEYEIDIGNKIYPDQKYVFTKEHQEVNYESEDGWNELNLLVINIDSDEVRIINKENEDYYDKYKSYYANESLIKDEKRLPTLFYNYWIYDDILSVVCYYWDENDTNTNIYNIDIKNKKILSNEEFLKSLNIDKNEFKSLVYDSLFSSYLLEKSVDYYNDFNKYLEDIKFQKNEKKFEIDYNKICELCDLSLGWSDNQILVNGLVVPTYWHPGTKNDISINMEPTYIFDYDYGFHIHYENYVEHYGNYVSNHLPIINLKSDDADRVNKESEEFFEKAKETIEKNGGELVIKAIETDEILKLKDEIVVNKDGEQVIEDYYTIDYSCEIINGQILTILVEETNTKYSNLDHGMNENYVYNFDLETGKLLSNKEFIEKCGYSEEDFEKKLDSDLDIENLIITPLYGVSGVLHEPAEVDEITEFYVFENNNSYPYEWKKIEMK